MTLNSVFVVGNTLPAAQMNNMPFGRADSATSASNYTLTTSIVAVPGLSVTWTAVAGRFYKITFYEPRAQTASVVGGFTTLELRQTSAAGTLLAQTILVTQAASTIENGLVCMFLGTFTAGSTTVLGCAATNNITGTPQLLQSGTFRGIIVCEDIG